MSELKLQWAVVSARFVFFCLYMASGICLQGHFGSSLQRRLHFPESVASCVDLFTCVCVCVCLREYARVWASVRAPSGIEKYTLDNRRLETLSIGAGLLIVPRTQRAFISLFPSLTLCLCPYMGSGSQI